jgi:hypothetical protein
MSTLVKQEGANYTYITTGATTQVNKGRTTLEAIIVNKALTGTITIIDGIAGSTANVAVMTNGTTAPLGVVPFNIICGSGLRIINSATEDITVTWR